MAINKKFVVKNGLVAPNAEITGVLTADSIISGNTTLDTLVDTAYTNAISYTDAEITALGLGSISTQNSNSVNISGGSISGITDLAIADGGTGASDASSARTNLGLGSIATQNSNSVNIDGGTIDGTAVNATNLAYTGTLTGGTGVVNLGSGQVFKDANGNVGVGTNTPTSPDGTTVDNPLNGLVQTIYGSSPALNLIDNSASGWSLINFGRLGGTTNSYRSVIGYDQANDTLQFSSRVGLIFKVSNSNIDIATERMRIDSSGNVGIGTTAPSAKLDVRGTQVVKPRSDSGKMFKSVFSGGSAVTTDLLTFTGIGASDSLLVIVDVITSGFADSGAGITRYMTGVRNVSGTATPQAITEISSSTFLGTNPKATLSWSASGASATLSVNNNTIFAATMYEVSVASYGDGGSRFNFIG